MRQRAWWAIVFCALVALVARGPVTAYAKNGDAASAQQELQATDGISGDGFGVWVALSSDGRVALIGAYAKNSLMGAAYVFVRHNNTWIQAQELLAADGSSGDRFGRSVALSADGNVALIGAPGKNASGGVAGKGAAYVFVRHNHIWTQQQELQATDGTLGDRFGVSAALSGDGKVALMGAPTKTGSTGAGAAYVFTQHNDIWTQQQELQAMDGAAGDLFGYSAALSNDGRVALIGAFGKNTSRGAAYVFAQYYSWAQLQEVQATDGAAGDDFGISVALSDNGRFALVGADAKDGKGAAYVFARDYIWTQQQELQAKDGAAGDSFGESAALANDGTVALIGANGKNGTGAAYVFGRHDQSWTQQQELLAKDGVTGDDFGFSGALSDHGQTALIGAFGKNASTGAAYVFEIDDGR